MTLLIDALNKKNRGRPPVWLMRQAGRYMPSYRQLRNQHSLLDMFRSSELITKVTLMPIEQLNVDGAILFSDILILLDMIGVEWDVKPGIGPVIAQPTDTISHIHPPEEAIPFVGEAIKKLCKELSVPLLGFCGAPFTIASYLIEGRGNKQLLQTRKLMYSDPERFHRLLQKLCDAAIMLLRYQVSCGAQAVQIFDSWAHWLSPHAFAQYSLHYLKQIAASVDVPVILFCRGTAMYAEQLATIDAAISLDWQCSLPAMRKKMNHCLQGNFDPALLYSSPATIEKAIHTLMQEMGQDPAYIVNLGHGLLPDTPVEHVRHFVHCVRNH